MGRGAFALLAVALCLVALAPFAAAISEFFTVQGRLTSSSGSALTGNYKFEFVLYDGNGASKGIVWSETRNLPVSNGIFTTDLGDANTANYLNMLDFNTELWLGIIVEDEAQTPLIRFSSISGAFMAK